MWMLRYGYRWRIERARVALRMTNARFTGLGALLSTEMIAGKRYWRLLMLKVKGFQKIVVAAAGWYRRSAEQGNAIAQRQLAIAYINGEGVQRNANEAVKWYRAAAEQGDVIAQIGLGVSYYRGDGVLQDSAEAAKWYERAAAYGDQNAQGRLADLYARGLVSARTM